MSKALISLLVVSAATALAGCSSVRPSQLVGDTETVIQQTLKGSPDLVSACLRANSTRASYPRGYSPSFVFEKRNGAGLLVEQWFDSGNDSTWTTTFDLQPNASNTLVEVKMPAGLKLAQAYTRAARELVGWCDRAPA